MHQRLKTNAARWLFCFALMLGLMMVVSGPAMAKSGYTSVSKWDDLQYALQYSKAPIELSDDWPEEPPVKNDPLTIDSGRDITLNLNGKTLSRKISVASPNGNIIQINGGKLTLEDTSQYKKGKITGGNTTGKGGGVSVVNGGTFFMTSGTITGNRAAQGGGVYVDSDSRFRLSNSGSIIGNIASNTGGGVHSNGDFYMSGNGLGKIQGNTANQGGGVYSTGTFSLNNSIINRNSASKNVGGIYAESNFTLQGKTSISGNTVDNANNNVYLNNAKISVSDYTPSSPIGVTLASGTGDITTNANHTDETAKKAFTSDNANYEVYSNGGQAALRTPATPTDPTDPAQAETYTVNLTGGANATHTSISGSDDPTHGDITLTVTRGERMQEVKYVANSNSHFTQFNEFAKNGVTVKWQNGKTVTVSGIPTDDVEIIIPDAVADSTDPTPGGDETPISATVTFKVVNGAWNTGETTDKSFTLSGTSANPPKLTLAQIPSVGGSPNEGYKAGSWDVAPTVGTEITEDTTFTYTYAEKKFISRTVTFKVKNGAWDDGTTADKTVTLSGYDDKELNLTTSQIPAVGNKPNTDFKAGHWDVVPDTDANITNNTTYTYSYAHKDSITRTVTFKVVNDAWDDTTIADEIITLIGNEGDTLRLSAYQIPDVDDSPNEGFKAGSWDVTPSTETPITADTTYTYTYVKDEPTIPDQPTVTEVTHHSITIQVNPDEEASIDGGNTWVRPKVDETTVTFDNLEPGTDYTILIRKIAADGKDPSAPSDPLEVKTNPHGQIKSQVIIGDDLPNLTVNGFDDALAAKLCTPEDHEALEAGDDILFTLRVTKQDNPPAEDKALCDRLAAEIGQSAAFSLDLSVDRKSAMPSRKKSNISTATRLPFHSISRRNSRKYPRT